MQIAITGASGMIGRLLVEKFTNDGHKLKLLVRNSAEGDGRHQLSHWNPQKGEIVTSDLEHQDLVIHLSGKNIAASRWTDRHKQEILESRTSSTRLLSEAIASLKNPPLLFLSASAIGYYGNRDPEEKVDENSAIGTGFMADVCRAWEESCEPARNTGIRVINMRFGLILSRSGGALAKMSPPFRFGLGGKVGSGNQMMSWISLDEFPAIIQHLVKHTEICGPVNFVSPIPVSNAQFTQVLGEVLHRPTIFNLPAFAAKLAFGEMAEELLLSGARVLPRKLLDSGYDFVHKDLGATLKALLIHQRLSGNANR